MMETKGSRLCPNCKAVYKDKNVTTCLKCGHPTIDRIVIKGFPDATVLGK